MIDLDEFIRTTKETLELKRALAVKNTLEGHPWQQVAQELCVSRSFVCKWRSLYKKDGIECLRLGYHGSEGYLSADEKQHVITWLIEQKQRSVQALMREIATRYDVEYQSKQSYYELMKQADMSWKKSQKRNPERDSEEAEAKREEIREKAVADKSRILSKDAVWLFADECHLLWGDALGYVWGPRGERIELPIMNERQRQTYYGAINMLTGRAFTFPAEAGNTEHTVDFLKSLRRRFQGRQLVILRDGASYHRSDMLKVYLNQINGNRTEAERRIHLIRFAPNAPDQNPMEDVWLAAKQYMRKHWYESEVFEDVKHFFSTFIEYMTFHFEKFNWYGRLQLI